MQDLCFGCGKNPYHQIMSFNNYYQTKPFTSPTEKEQKKWARNILNFLVYLKCAKGLNACIIENCKNKI